MIELVHHNEAAEASILGGVILRNEVLLDLETLETDDFYHLKHKVIWQAIRNLEATAKPIDPVTLETEVEKQGKLDAIGGIGFIGELALRVPTADNVVAYAEEVQLYARNRRATLAIAEALDRAKRWPHNAEDLVPELVGELSRIAVPRPSAALAARVVTLADVQPERVEWLWQGRVPRGMLTLVDGDPGLGKSTMTLDLAARLTSGAPMPLESYAGRVADVVLMTAEDALAATIRPRLDAAGADVRRVHAITAMPRPRDADAPPTLAPEDIAKIEAEVVRTKAGLVIIDPLAAFLGADVDMHKDQDVRRVLRVLSAAAERTGAAIVVVRHLKKGAGPALYRGGGSIGIAGAARSVLLVAEDPDGKGARVVASTKSNLAPLAPSLRWRLVDAGDVARIEWEGVAEGVTADQLAATPERHAEDEASSVDRAAAALRDVLSDGPVPVDQATKFVIGLAACSERTVERARKKLGVEAVRVRSADGRRVARIDLRLIAGSTPPDLDVGGVGRR